MTKIKKILIANRGEIAVRVMETCLKMGIGSVAVYSDADRKALHVRTADEAVHIGASPAAESYLVIDKIIAACKSSGADAVHPGYGFLSENPEFARRLKEEGIIFIGPAPESMEAMGLKDAAKKLMEKAGVPVTPGYHGKDQSPKLLKAKAGMIGYPVLIKAVAGGGGKGMRKVDAADDFEDALASCMREAKSAFGDDRVLIEKYILSPRHIEVQVFGDTYGNIVHMYERDCSLQRRHQKVIEEAPAPGMTEDVRKAMTDAAIEAARAVNYVGAGTVEFIVDGSGKLRTDGFWFMEMNTRLQVEHPVTEMITGLDLVELQIRVAQGEKLPKQKDIKKYGHAFEARIYAEDPANDFLPSVGKLSVCHYPLGALSNEGLRIDASVWVDDEVSVFYDPMIAKIITHEKTRSQALESLIGNLGAVHMYPIKNNVNFLRACLRHKAFRAGSVNTNFIPDYFPNFSDGPKLRAKALRDLASQIYVRLPESGKSPFTHMDGWRLNREPRIATSLSIDGEDIVFAYSQENNLVTCKVAGHTLTCITTDPREVYENRGAIFDLDNGFVLFSQGQAYMVTEFGLGEVGSSDQKIGAIIAPMPGKIIAVNVAVGDNVKAGDKLIIMEAMKMEMSLYAPRDGVVAAVHCMVDALVSDGVILLELEQEDK